MGVMASVCYTDRTLPVNLGPFQTSLFSCDEPKVNEQNPLFEPYTHKNVGNTLK